jgi:hypothetical protein
MKFLRVMLIAALGASSASARESWLSREDMTKYFEGKTVIGKYVNGTPFTETYWAGGAISYRDSFVADQGHWNVTAQGFCTFYDNVNGACFQMRLEGANCFDFFAVEDQTTGPMQDGKPVMVAQGWFPDRPSTCIALSS